MEEILETYIEYKIDRYPQGTMGTTGSIICYARVALLPFASLDCAVDFFESRNWL